jgi:hypothetical protein
MLEPQRTQRNTEETSLTLLPSVSSVVQAFLLLRTRQNELSPNQANDAVKHMARISRPGPATCPDWNFAYSRNPAAAPTAASARKVKPVTSSQSWWSTRPNDKAVVRRPFRTAAPTRLRPSCWAATRATIPIFFAVESRTIRSILAADGRRIATRGVTEACDAARPVRHSRKCAIFPVVEGGLWIRS